MRSHCVSELILLGLLVLALALLGGCYPATVPGSTLPQSTASAPGRPAAATGLPPAPTTVPVRPPSPPITPAATTELPAAVRAAQAFIARQMGTATESVAVVRAEPVEWTDSCLGAGRADEICAQVITPGYRIVFKGAQGELEVHTDQSGQSVRIAKAGTAGSGASTPAPGSAAVIWERTGGIAGVCQRLTVGADGAYTLEDCKRNTVLNAGVLSQADAASVNDWLGRLGALEWRSKNPPGSADMFNDRLSLKGRGSAVPSETDIVAINEYLSGLWGRLRGTSQ